MEINPQKYRSIFKKKTIYSPTETVQGVTIGFHFVKRDIWESEREEREASVVVAGNGATSWF